VLESIHFLLTYECTWRCDHCFLFCRPGAGGTFTLARLKEAFRRIASLESIGSVYFEGGEPFLYFPLLREGVRLARAQGLGVGIVTNCYWALGEEDARLWLDDLAALGLENLSLSDDAFHYEGPSPTPAEMAAEAARALGLPAGSICIDRPEVSEEAGEKGGPVLGGGAKIRGRAAETLVEGLPRHSVGRFTECPYEELASPSRVHLDAMGNLHICQGLLMGNLWKTPLGEIAGTYDARAHPVAGPLLRGGPAALAAEGNLAVEKDGYVDACHACYLLRRSLLDRYPELLGPGLVYGLEEGARDS
jgi:hypothetical protein